MNAIAHCVEALYAHDGNPIVSLMAEEGIRALALALPNIVASPKNPQGRIDALYGAWLAGTTIGTTSVALHHKLCHVLGGSTCRTASNRSCCRTRCATTRRAP